MSNIPRTPPHRNRSNMSAEEDDQDIELVEHQQFNRGAGLQTYPSNVPLDIDQEKIIGRQLFSTVMALSSQISSLVSDMAVVKDHMQQQQQSMLDSTLQLGNQTVPLIFGNATPINRPTIIGPTMFSPYNYYWRSASSSADANYLFDERRGKSNDREICLNNADQQRFSHKAFLIGSNIMTHYNLEFRNII